MASKSKSAVLLSSKVVYGGPVFQVTRDLVREPGGIQSYRDVVRHHGSSVILAVDDSDAALRVLLVRQYRHAAGRFLWELPAGHIEPGERPLHGAKRELREETGYTAARWRLAFSCYPSPGFLEEKFALYLALGLKKGSAAPEQDEQITCRLFPLSAVVAKATTGALPDAKTIAGVLWLETLRLQGNLRRTKTGSASLRMA